MTVGHEKASLIDTLIYTNLAQSKSDAKRLIEQGGVSIDGKVKSDPSEILDLEKEKVIKVGKFKSAKLKSS